MTTTTEEERVTAGFAFLTRRLGPGWWLQVNLDSLDLRSPCHCVLGQAGRAGPDTDWDSICDRFGVTPWCGLSSDIPSAYDLGFNAIRVPPTTAITLAENRANNQAFASLTAAWKRLILAARGEGAAR